MKHANKLLPILLFTAACGQENALQEQRAAVVALCDNCDDPLPVVGTVTTGGGAGVDTSSTAAAAHAKENARRSACTAAKMGLTAPPCPDAANCDATSSIECTYANERCPIVGDFANNPREWVAACRLSNEPAAWKTANCNTTAGPAGKPSFVLCTVDATATASTECKPKSKTCDAQEPLAVATDSLSLVAEECMTHCDPQTDSKLASGKNSAIDTTAAAATAAGLANAKTDAQTRAAAKLRIPACAADCKPFGAPMITYTDYGGRCYWVDRYDSSGPPGNQPDDNGDGIGDWWAEACASAANRSIHDLCDQVATATAKPWGAWCSASAKATGTQLCVDDDSTCAIAEADATETGH